MSVSHLNAPTRFIEVDGDRFAYRRWGKSSGAPPLFFIQHFRGGMDHWDPVITDGLAEGREVILFDGRGISASSGTPRNRMEEMADDIAAVIRALGLAQVDLLGFSIGGFQAQEVTLRHPNLVRKLILLGTGPRGGDPTMHPQVLEVAPGPCRRWKTSSFCSSDSLTRQRRPALNSGCAATGASIKIRRAPPRSHKRKSRLTLPTSPRWRVTSPMRI